MRSFATSAKESVQIGVSLLLELILEAAAFFVIGGLSLVLSLCISRAVFLVWSPSTSEVFNTTQTILACWLIGILTLQWVRSWKPWITPRGLQHFQELGHSSSLICVGNNMVFLSFIACTYLQVSSFFAKFYEEMDTQTEPDKVYLNNQQFQESLYTLVYLSVRYFQFYGNINKDKVQFELGKMVRCPQWLEYLDQYLCLLAYELYLSGMTLLVVFGIAVIFQEENKLYSAWPYVISCLVSDHIGSTLGIQEEEQQQRLDNRMNKRDPYYRVIRWDVRFHLLTFGLLPIQSLLYFPPLLIDFKNEKRVELFHNLLHLAFTAIIWMVYAEGWFLVREVMNGHRWKSSGSYSNNNRNLSDSDAVRSQATLIRNGNNVFPPIRSNGDPLVVSGGEENYSYSGWQPYPPNENANLQEIRIDSMNRQRDRCQPKITIENVIGAARGSVSIGTCISVVNNGRITWKAVNHVSC